MPKKLPKTITLFDGPSGDQSTNARSLEAVPFSAVPTITVQAKSLLIESLVEQLCAFIEQEPSRQRKLFLYICQKLTELRFLSPGLPQDEAQPTRRKFKELTKNFIKLSIKNYDVQTSNALIPREMSTSALLSLEFPYDLSGFMNGEIIVHTSRYSIDFEEEGVIARGGFGVVCKAWKKVDQQYYAVKKIPFKYLQDPLLNKVLREVEFLAQNSHPNVVAYKTAWIEPSTVNDLDLRSDSSSDTSFNSLMPSEPKYARTEEDSTWKMEEDSDFIVFTAESTERYFKSETYQETCKISVLPDDDVPSLKTVNKTCQQFVHNNIKITGDSNERTEVIGTKKSSSDPRKKKCGRPKYRRSSSEVSIVNGENMRPYCDEKMCKGVLYVQMELCQESLKNWLDRRCESAQDVDFAESLSILKQVVKGVEYLHSKGIIHRDLKPQNILFSENCIKIGDFGLATLCCQQGMNGSGDNSLFGWTNHTQGVGTSPYAAPEQMRGKQYGFKADMYSVGVIMLELLYSFKTSMELSKCLEDVGGQKQNLPKRLMQSYPEVVRMITQLTQINPTFRPSASEVLNSEVFLSKSQVIESLKREIAMKDSIIRDLEEEMKMLRSRCCCNQDCQ